MAFQYDIATPEDIIEHCSRSNSSREVISELDGGLSVIKLAEDVVVKCGFGGTQLEADNQKLAHELIDPAIIRIPRVHVFFNQGFVGYLVMEYIEGQPLSSIADPASYLQAVVRVLKSFETVRSEKPGPLHGGVANGYLWLDETIAPRTVSDIEEYYNLRQLKHLPKLELQRYPLVFCHLDIAPRNVIVLENGSLGLVDWGTAGFYPRLFERCTLRLNAKGPDDWNARLLLLLDLLDEDEKSQAQLLEQAYYLGQRYS
jgi:aminoglycoside phosphotransferase